MYGYSPAYSPYAFRPVYPLDWTPSKVELNRKLRALWEQHVYWTRLTVNSIVDRLPDENETTKRLLRNPEDFAAVLKPLYGSAIAAKFAELFTEHIHNRGRTRQGAAGRELRGSGRRPETLVCQCGSHCRLFEPD
ncbi:hypothetical protein [Paenibacillus caui]|uniref:hypothetical protein n=1 Tax=Paenibacillus caui TaxID=2873927 RepID=UPI001F1B5654|nr:hypothetical protein [Paenibacillus caui]